jgi:hypothetical protein
MESFERVWEASRTITWSWAYPRVLWPGVAVLIVLSLVRNAWIRRAAKIMAIVALAVAATEYSAREIEEKWRIRAVWAKDHSALMTSAAWDALATDGANRTLGPLIYGFLAFVLLAVVSVSLWGLRVLISRIRQRRIGKVDAGSQHSHPIRPA